MVVELLTLGTGRKGITFRNYSKGILSSDSTCHIEIHLSNNLSIDVLIF